MGKRKKSGQKRKPQPSELVKLIRTPTGSTFDCPTCSGKGTLEIKIKTTHSAGKSSIFSLGAQTTITAKISCKSCSASSSMSNLNKSDAPIDVYYKYLNRIKKAKKLKKEEAEEDYYEEDVESNSDEEPQKKRSKKAHSTKEDDSNLFGDYSN